MRRFGQGQRRLICSLPITQEGDGESVKTNSQARRFAEIQFVGKRTLVLFSHQFLLLTHSLCFLKLNTTV